MNLVKSYHLSHSTVHTYMKRVILYTMSPYTTTYIPPTHACTHEHTQLVTFEEHVQ